MCPAWMGEDVADGDDGFGGKEGGNYGGGGEARVVYEGVDPDSDEVICETGDADFCSRGGSSDPR